MKEIFVIEHDNGMSYEDNYTIVDEYFFESYEEAEQYLLSKGFTKEQGKNGESDKYVDLTEFETDYHPYSIIFKLENGSLKIK